MIFFFSLSNVGLLTRIMMKQIQRNITRHKEKAKMLFFFNFTDIQGFIFKHMLCKMLSFPHFSFSRSPASFNQVFKVLSSSCSFKL